MTNEGHGVGADEFSRLWVLEVEVPLAHPLGCFAPLVVVAGGGRDLVRLKILDAIESSGIACVFELVVTVCGSCSGRPVAAAAEWRGRCVQGDGQFETGHVGTARFLRIRRRLPFHDRC